MIRRSLAFLSAYCLYLMVADASPSGYRNDNVQQKAPEPNPAAPSITGDAFNKPFVGADNPAGNQKTFRSNQRFCGGQEESTSNGAQSLRVLVETSGSSYVSGGRYERGGALSFPLPKKKRNTGNTITIDFGTTHRSTTTASGSSALGLINSPTIHGLPRILSLRRRGGGERTSSSRRRIEYEKPMRKKMRNPRREKGAAASTALEAEEAGGKVTMSIDLSDSKRIHLPILIHAGSTMVDAVVWTLRLLAPLIVARRFLNAIGYFCKDIIWNLPMDYLTGLYIRKTYTRLERAYLRYYELPSALRATARTLSQIFTLFVLSGLVGWMYSIGEPPCREDGRGLSLFCGILWIGAVVTSGHAFSTAVSTWGGPLRLHISSHPKNKQVYTRPSHFLSWVKDLEEWTSMMSKHEEVLHFDPNPLIFPATWLPCRLLLIFAVARAFNTDPSAYRWCSSKVDQVPKLMKQFLVQLSLGDEWQKVFLVEKRVGLGVLVAIAYFIALAILITTSFTINGVAAALMIPSLLAAIVSGWMNIVIFLTRLNLNKKEAAVKAMEERKREALGTFKLGNTYYN